MIIFNKTLTIYSFVYDRFRKVTLMKLREIAAQAGVSLTTVSLVLNGRPGVSAAKRSAILQLLEENGYTNRIRKEDASRRSICFLRYIDHGHLVNGNPGFSSQILDAVEKRCRQRGYTLQVATVYKSQHDDTGLLPLLLSPAVEGVIVLATELSDEDACAISGIPKPYVALDNLLPGRDCTCITMNNRDSILEAVQHLHGLGHEDIGFLYSSLPCFNDIHRRRAYVYALERLGLPVREELIFSVFPTMDGACQSVRSLLDSGVRFPSALIANNDCIAIGAMRAFRELGLRIPEDISVIGFDGLPFSAVSDPPLSTIEVPCAELGRLSADLLLDNLANPRSTHLKVMMNTRLLLRSSTGPAPIAARTDVV